MLKITVISCFFAACAVAIASEPVLIGNPATPDELIADQVTIAPCWTPVEFTSFRYPHVDADETVTFIADDRYYRGGKKFGTYRSSGKTGAVEKLVNNEEAPQTGLPQFADFLGLQVHGQNFVFRARTLNAAVEGIYGDFGDGLRTIADTLGKGSPAGSGFSSFGYADVCGDLAIFVATDKREIGAIFSNDAIKRTTRRLVSIGDVLPNGSVISYLRGQPWMDEKSIVFRALDGDRRPGIYRIQREALSKSDVLPVEALFNQASVLPDAIRIKDITSAPVDGDRIAFCVSGLDARGGDYRGIFLLQDGTVTRVVDNHTEIPEKGVVFQEFNQWISLKDGILLFRGFGEDGFEGLFAYDTSNDELHFLLDNQAKIDGRKISGFEIGSSPMVGNRMVFLAVFEDGNDAIYLASLAKGFLPMHRELPGIR